MPRPKLANEYTNANCSATPTLVDQSAFGTSTTISSQSKMLKETSPREIKLKRFLQLECAFLTLVT